MWGMSCLGPSLVAGAAAAVGLFVVELISGPAGFGREAAALYWMVFALVFSAVGATRRSDILRRTRVVAFGIVAIAWGWLGLLSEWERVSGAGLALLALGLSCVYAVARSGLLDEGSGLNVRRALIVEGALGVASLAFGAWLLGPGPFGPALALWGFALVQSLHVCVPRSFLVGPMKRRLRQQPEDTFELALGRLESVLGDVLH